MDIGSLARYQLSSLGDRPPDCTEVIPAWWRLVSTHESVGGLFGTLYAVRRLGADAGSAGLTDSSQDLLRAAIVFSSAGLDACLEVLISHAVPVLVSGNEKSRGKFERYIDSQARAPKSPRSRVGARVRRRFLGGRIAALLFRARTSQQLQERKDGRGLRYSVRTLRIGVPRTHCISDRRVAPGPCTASRIPSFGGVVRLTRIRVKNFQSFGPEPTVLNLEAMNYLLGPNGAGKTSVLTALGAHVRHGPPAAARPARGLPRPA